MERKNLFWIDSPSSIRPAAREGDSWSWQRHEEERKKQDRVLPQQQTASISSTTRNELILYLWEINRNRKRFIWIFDSLFLLTYTRSRICAGRSVAECATSNNTHELSGELSEKCKLLSFHQAKRSINNHNEWIIWKKCKLCLLVLLRLCEPPTRFAITSHCTDPLREKKYLEYFHSHALHLCELLMNST